MMRQDAPDETTLVRLVGRRLGTGPRDIQLRRIPTGKFNTSYHVDGGAVPLVLRIAPQDDRSQMLFYEHRMMRQEPTLHSLLRKQTDVPVPAIMVSDFSHTEIDRDYLLMERIPGTPLSGQAGLTPATLNDILREVGRCLRQVHALTSDHYGYPGEHRPIEPQPDWASAFQTMWNLLLDDVEQCGGYNPTEAASMRQLPDRHMKVFDRPVAASLLHMDVWAENILADEHGRLTGLIDWDRALWGDPEIEFAVLDYCGISEPAFWEGYGAVREQTSEAEIRRVFYLLYEIQKYIVIRRVRGHDRQRADVYRRQSLRLAESLKQPR
jgi:aminoglycoside phosphotransferase (APT) family kinase protein